MYIFWTSLWLNDNVSLGQKVYLTKLVNWLNLFNKNKYKSIDINQKLIVIAATNDQKVNRKVYKDANKKDIPVNVVDQPDLCSFYMGSTYQDWDLKIAISTNAKCPSFGVFLLFSEQDHAPVLQQGWTTLAQSCRSLEHLVLRGT